jgi:hypothetical protein
MRIRVWIGVLAFMLCSIAAAQNTPARLYAYPTVTDRYGVIAPWYRGQNGQCDFRVRVAAETLKRYPWVSADRAVAAAPHYVFSGAWRIDADGTITVPPIDDWANGDLGQRAAYVLSGLVDYYRYTGDPAAISHIALTADALLDYMLTPADHPWPGILVTVPVKGTPYGKADPHGFIQLDIVAEVGIGLVRAYKLTGNRRYLEAAKHWGDLFAEKRRTEPGVAPWSRYADPEDANWEDLQTGGVVFILEFLDELIDMGYRGKDGALIQARTAGRRYLRQLLDRWTVDDTWGRNYWDWPDYVQAENVTEFAVRYLMDHPDAFPNWRTDCRNILSLFLNRTSVSPASNGDVFAGAWAYPESSGCCGRSLWYGPMELAMVYAQYAALADSEWAREMARRQMILATYDCHETGVVEDNIDGGAIVAGAWFKIAHPMALKHCLGAIAWMPDVFGASRENHIVRSSSVVKDVRYADGRVEFATFDAKPPCVTVLRLAFEPERVAAGSASELTLRPMAAGDVRRTKRQLRHPGYACERLRGGDYLVTIRHDGVRRIVIEGDDPQREAPLPMDDTSSGAAVLHDFTGNQVRVLGTVGPDGGLADVYLDGEKQLVPIDCWCPQKRAHQVLYYHNGLAQGPHTLKIVARGEGNPVSGGARVTIQPVQWSDATGSGGSGSGGGPTEAQRVIFGYAGRTDYVDSQGHAWRPATEFIVRLAHLADVVEQTWWTERRQLAIGGTPDPELYRYGVHAKDFTVYFTVGPGTYHARLKFAETRRVEPRQRAVSVAINGEPVVEGLDIAATAGGYCCAADLVFNGLEPKSGVISLRFTGTRGGEVIVQAIEVGPGDGGEGAKPICVGPPPARQGNLLTDPGFEEGARGDLGSLGKRSEGFGWTYLFASPTQSYIWGESAYSIHPNWGLPEVRTGKEALRTHTEGDGHTVVFQEIDVSPNTVYRACVWVHAVDLHGRGFGAHPGDSAGLKLQELADDGTLLVDHEKLAVTKPCDYTELAKTFTTTEKTTRLRFLLDTLIGGPYNEGHVTYDDCAVIPQ